MVAGSGQAANISNILVLMYRIFVTNTKILKNYTKNYIKRMSSHTGR